MSAWAILCPGKSLQSYQGRAEALEFDDGNIIAVNYALLFRDVTPAYWALMDGEVLKECHAKDWMRVSAPFPDYIFWVPRNYENSGRTAEWNHDQAECYRNRPALHWHKISEFLPQPSSAGERILWDECTLFSAIGLAVLLGAKKINVYGADFDGQGYFIEGVGNFRTDHRPARWTREGENFYRIQNVLLDRDIVLLRHTERA